MKGVKGASWEEIEKNLRKNLSNLYEKHKYLRENLDERNKKRFEKIWKYKYI